MRRTLCWSLLVAGALMAPMNGWAQAIPRIGDFGIDAESLAEFVANRQVILINDPIPFSWTYEGEPHQAEVRFVSGMIVIDAPVTAVRSVVRDYDRYEEFMPQTEEVEVVAREENRTRVAYELSFELPVVNIGIDYTLEHVDEPNGDITWRLLEGDLDAVFGRWELLPLPGDRTLAIYTNWTNLASMSFIVRKVLEAQPDLKLAIPVSSVAVVLQAVKRRVEGKPATNPPARPPAQPVIPLVSRGALPRATVANLARRGTLVLIHPSQWIRSRGRKEPTELIFVTAGRVMPAPVTRARELATAFERYGEFFDQVKKVRAQRTPRGFRVDWKLGLGFGILSVPVRYTLEYVWADENVLPFQRVKGDIGYIYGAWEWIPVGPTETLTLYTTASELGEKAPAILKLGNLIPNRQMVVGVSSSAIVIEKQRAWIAQQAR